MFDGDVSEVCSGEVVMWYAKDWEGWVEDSDSRKTWLCHTTSGFLKWTGNAARIILLCEILTGKIELILSTSGGVNYMIRTHGELVLPTLYTFNKETVTFMISASVIYVLYI